MNVIEISCPAKTFIVGEYAVLDGGSSILLNTAPRFTCHIQKHSKTNLLNLHENSPAGQWVKKNPHDFQAVQIKWFDTYEKRGGLGFSSAQFNILYAYSCILRKGSIDQINPQEVWRSYRKLQFEGFLPSGADVITQWVGGVCVFEQKPLSVETLTLSLPNLHCMVLRTGSYFETYRYLKDFKLGDVSDLKKIAQETVDIIEKREEEAFIESINSYRKALEAKNYITQKTKDILDKLLKVKAIKACKGCGALGAETLIIFFKKEDTEEVKQASSFLEVVTDQDQITYGLTFNKITKQRELLN